MGFVIVKSFPIPTQTLNLNLVLMIFVTCWGSRRVANQITIVKFTQLCSKLPPTALVNFACDG